MHSPQHVSQKELLELEEMELYRDELKQELQEVRHELQELEMEEQQTSATAQPITVPSRQLSPLADEHTISSAAERVCEKATPKQSPSRSGKTETHTPKYPSPLLYSLTATEQRGDIYLTPPKEHARETEEPLLPQLLIYLAKRSAMEAKKSLAKSSTSGKTETHAPKYQSPLLYSRTATEQRGDIYLTPPKEHARETEEPLLPQLLTYLAKRSALEAEKAREVKKALENSAM